MDTITIPKPINGHGHLRQGELFVHLVRMARRLFSHYFGMGNTKPPIILAEEAAEYKNAAYKIDEAVYGHYLSPYLLLCASSRKRGC